LRALETELAARVARERYETVQADDAGVRRVVERRASGSLDELRPLALATASLPRAVFVGAVESPAALLVAASDDSGFDAGRAIKAALADAGGRGGGSARLAQATLPSREALDRVLASIGGVR